MYALRGVGMEGWIPFLHEQGMQGLARQGPFVKWTLGFVVETKESDYGPQTPPTCKK